MCTFIDRFPEYKTVIVRCINSCENKVQLLCAYDMIDRFVEVFRGNVSYEQLREATNELYGAYYEKESNISITV
jgi:hypothetical protein